MKNTEIWVFIFLLGLLSFNWPLLEIFHTEVVAYLFVTWLLFIMLIAFAARRTNSNKESDT